MYSVLETPDAVAVHLFKNWWGGFGCGFDMSELRGEVDSGTGPYGTGPYGTGPYGIGLANGLVTASLWSQDDVQWLHFPSCEFHETWSILSCQITFAAGMRVFPVHRKLVLPAEVQADLLDAVLKEDVACNLRLRDCCINWSPSWDDLQLQPDGTAMVSIQGSMHEILLMTTPGSNGRNRRWTRPADFGKVVIVAWNGLGLGVAQIL